MTEPGASELPEDVARRIDEMTERVGVADHYVLLGLPRTATRAQIRTAFLAVAPPFHPDRYFGRNLGAYANKMLRIFAHLSEAHDTLVNDERRAEYDRFLPPPPPSPPPPPPPPAAAPPSPRPPQTVADGHARPPLSSHPPSSGTLRATAPSTPEQDRARQQVFASRLGGRMRPPTPAVPLRPGAAPAAGGSPGKTPSDAPPRARSSSPTMPAVDPKAAVDALKRRYEESKAHARGMQTSQSVVGAEAAAAKGDFAEAARLYHLAVERTQDPGLRAAMVAAEAKAREQHHAAVIARAREAEQKQDYVEAAANWARAFESAPSADVANRAAMCLRRAGADVRKAARFGEDAVKLDPNKAAYRVTLALVYADAGLVLRARGEIERAQALEPDSALVKDALAKLKGLR